MSICIYQGSYDPPPEGFAARFVKGGWRAVEHYYGPNNEVRMRWFAELGYERLKGLRRRYMRGDLSALDEATAPLPLAAE